MKTPSLRVGLLEVDARRVDAIAKSGRLRTVVEDVAEVATAVGTRDLGSHHPERPVFVLVDVLVDVRRDEARPAAARVELGFGSEQRSATAGAEIHAIFVVVPTLLVERGMLPA